MCKTFGVDPIDEEGANYFMFNYQEKYIRVTSGNPVPGATHKIRATYRYEVPVITRVSDSREYSRP